VLYDDNEHTAYVAGTNWHHGLLHALGDVYADVTQVPFMRTSRNARYTWLDDTVRSHQVEHLVGHSLGAAVVGQYLTDHPDLHVDARLYGWPTLGVNTDQRITSHKGYGDPVALGDLTAEREIRFNPHGYS